MADRMVRVPEEVAQLLEAIASQSSRSTSMGSVIAKWASIVEPEALEELRKYQKSQAEFANSLRNNYDD